jgi:group I intron endonuclease
MAHCIGYRVSRQWAFRFQYPGRGFLRILCSRRLYKIGTIPPDYRCPVDAFYESSISWGVDHVIDLSLFMMDGDMIIYLVTNIVNGKQYIGATAQPARKRWIRHVWGSRNLERSKSCRGLCEAIAEFGPDSFEISTIASARSRADLHELERIIIAQYKTLYPDGYNLHPGGTGRGWKHDPATLIKMAASHRGRKCSPEAIANMSLGQQKRWARPEELARMRAQKQTPETRAKRSASMTGRQFSPQHLENLRLSHSTPEYKAKMAGKSRDPRWDRQEEREKQAEIMRKVQTLRWHRPSQ